MEKTGKQKLHELEKQNKYVFHGSEFKIETLEPRQAYNYPTNLEAEKIQDDKPAIFASPFADIAIFMAIINKTNAPKGFRSGFSYLDNGKLEFRTTKFTMDQILNAKGYVYVFDKNNFIARSEAEVLSYETVKPLEIMEVTEKDLPENITIKDF